MGLVIVVVVVMVVVMVMDLMVMALMGMRSKRRPTMITMTVVNSSVLIPQLPVVERHLARDENVAVMVEDVRVTGIHLVDGKVAPSQREWSLRQ